MGFCLEIPAFVCLCVKRLLSEILHSLSWRLHHFCDFCPSHRLFHVLFADAIRGVLALAESYVRGDAQYFIAIEMLRSFFRFPGVFMLMWWRIWILSMFLGLLQTIEVSILARKCLGITVVILLAVPISLVLDQSKLRVGFRYENKCAVSCRKYATQVRLVHHLVVSRVWRWLKNQGAVLGPAHLICLVLSAWEGRVRFE